MPMTIVSKSLSSTKILDAFGAVGAQTALTPPLIQVGDWVKLGVRIREGEKTRIQPFEGIVIAKKGHAGEQRIQVRKVFQNIGIERIFPLRSPCVATIQILKSNNPRRSKLYYLRSRTGRSAMRLRRR